MELLSLLFMSSCFLTLSGLTFGDQSGTSVFVKEGDYAILPCSLGTNENIESVRFEWKKEETEEEVFIYDNGAGYSPALRGRVSHSPDLQHGSASIRINNVQLKDKGNYTCDFPTRGKTFRIDLLVFEPVLKDRNVPGAAEPEITISFQRNELQCDVKNAYPKPTVEWRDSSNETIPSEEPQVSKQGDLFNITLKATVKKTDRYRCVATQEDIKHQAQKEINVHFDAKKNSAPQVLPVWAAILIGVIVAVVKV